MSIRTLKQAIVLFVVIVIAWVCDRFFDAPSTILTYALIGVGLMVIAQRKNSN